MWISPRWMKVFRDLWRNKARTGLVVLSTALGIFAFGLFFGTRTILMRELSYHYAATNPASAALYGTFEEDFIHSINKMPQVARAEGRRTFIVRVQVAPDEWEDLRLIAIDDFSDVQIAEFEPRRGAESPSNRGLLIEKTTLNLLRADLGQKITIKTFAGTRRVMEIEGLVHDFNAPPGSRYEGPAQGYITFEALEWLDQPALASELNIVVAENATDKEFILKVVEQIKERAKRNGTPVAQIFVPEPGKNVSTDTVLTVGVLMSVLGFFSLLLSGFLITNTLSAVLAQHIRQIGVMKAIGARTYQITGMYLAMVLSYSIFGLFLAIPLSQVLARNLSTYIANLLNFYLTETELPGEVLSAEIIAGLMIPIVAALFPILSGARQTVREAIASYGIGNTSPRRGWIDGRIEWARFLPRTLLLALRNTFRKTGRLALTLTTLTLASSLFMAVSSVRTSLFLTLDQLMSYWNYDIQVDLAQPYSIKKLNLHALKIAGVVQADAWAIGTATRLRPDGSKSADISLVAPPANTPLLNSQAGLIEGRWLLMEDTNAIVVNVDLLANEPDIRVGDAITLEIDRRKTVWNVVGTFRRVTTNRLPTAYVNAPYFSRLAHLVGQGTSLQVVTAQSEEEYTSQVVRDMEEHFRKSGIEVNSMWVTQSIRARVEYTFNVLASVLFLLAVLCGLVGALGLMGTMTLNVLERTREIGVMRAIGASSGVIRQIIIVEGWFIGILSWTFGAILSVPLSKFLSNALGIGTMRTPLTYGFSFTGVWLWLAIVLLLTTLASLLPAWNAARLTVRDVLAYE